MMVLGIDPHKKNHTVVAVEATTGELAGALAVSATRRGQERLLAWARSLSSERRFALEDLPPRLWTPGALPSRTR